MAAFIAHKACWLRSCRITYNTKLEHARKHSKDIPADEAGEGSSGVSKCTQSNFASSISQDLCFFCRRSSVSRVCCYARWIPVYLRDMLGLHKTHPEVLEVFQAGMFSVQKTKRILTSIATDQAHEQNNACIKGGWRYMLCKDGWLLAQRLQK